MKRNTHRFMLILLATLLGALFISCDSKFDKVDDDDDDNPDAIQILLIGNKFIYQQNINDTIRLMATADGQDVEIYNEIKTEYLLSNHASDADTYDRINEKQWDIVLLQGMLHYMAGEEWQEILLPAIRTLRDQILAKSPDCQIFYMAPWAFKNGYTPIAGYDGDYNTLQNDIINGCITNRADLNVKLAPVGAAWQDIMNNQLQIQLYEYGSNENPSAEGGFLVAASIYSALMQRDITNLNYFGSINPTAAATLRTAASAAFFNQLEDWGFED